MRLISFLLLLLTVSFNGYAQAHEPDGILGTWLTADRNGEITIYKENGLYFGKIKAGTNKERFDIKNPDKKRRNDPLIGLTILRDLKFDNKGWKDGTVYDPQNGKTYSCNLNLVDQNTLKITGYIGFSWIGRSELWTRLD
jgi:uncharacterized protein (DUF2147 family)